MTEDEAVDVFFYGLFMDKELLVEKGLHPANPRRATLENYDLLLGARAKLGPALGKRVCGIVMTLRQSEVNSLYAEASVSAYRPVTMTVTGEDGEPITALCYNLPPSDHGPPNKAYAAKLAALAARLQLPPGYVAELSERTNP